jgi:ABC-type lipoprotein export system ATPase subunit
MSRADLETLLAQLHNEIDAIVPSERQQRLRVLIGDLEHELAQTDPPRELSHGLRQRLATFEVEHPRVTAILNDIMVTLSNLGI